MIRCFYIHTNIHLHRYGTLYDGLPILQLPTFNISHSEFKVALDEYVESKQFRTAEFDGWKKMFAKHWFLLAAKAKDKPIVVDPSSGNQYYIKYNISCKTK